MNSDDVKLPIHIETNVAVSLGHLLNDLKMSHEDTGYKIEDDVLQVGSNCNNMEEDEHTQMTAMGLPVSFASGKRKRAREENVATVERFVVLIYIYLKFLFPESDLFAMSIHY